MSQTMTLEERILNIAEGPIWSDSRELRAIALEVRKREDRIKQLKDRIKRLEEALDLVRPNCTSVHHSKKHQHAYNQPCPVVALIEKAREAKP